MPNYGSTMDAPLMGIGGSSDDDPLMMLQGDVSKKKDTLSYNNMLLRNDGTVMTKEQIRELRDRQGYCLTCPGEPVKLYEIKKSKYNPLFKSKEPLNVVHFSDNGICLRCNPSADPNKGRRRTSLGATGPGDHSMLPGSLISRRTSTNDTGPLTATVNPPPGTTTTIALSGGSPPGGIGASERGRSTSSMKQRSRSISPVRSKSNQGLAGDFSNSSDDDLPLTSLSERGKSGATFNGTETSINSLAQAKAVARKLNPHPETTTSDDWAKGFVESEDFVDFSSTANNIKTKKVDEESTKPSNGKLKPPPQDQGDSTRDLKRLHSANAGLAPPRLDSEPRKSSSSSLGHRLAKVDRRDSVDSDGFIDPEANDGDASSQFQSSFVNMNPDSLDAATIKADELLGPKASATNDENNDDELLFKEKKQDDKESDKTSVASPEEIVVRTKPMASEKRTLKSSSEDASSARDLGIRGTNETSSLKSAEIIGNLSEQMHLLQLSVSMLSTGTEERLRKIEQEVALILEQQTLLLKQNTAMMKMMQANDDRERDERTAPSVTSQMPSTEVLQNGDSESHRSNSSTPSSRRRGLGAELSSRSALSTEAEQEATGRGSSSSRGQSKNKSRRKLDTSDDSKPSKHGKKLDVGIKTVQDVSTVEGTAQESTFEALSAAQIAGGENTKAEGVVGTTDDRSKKENKSETQENIQEQASTPNGSLSEGEVITKEPEPSADEGGSPSTEASDANNDAQGAAQSPVQDENQITTVATGVASPAIDNHLVSEPADDEPTQGRSKRSSSKRKSAKAPKEEMVVDGHSENGGGEKTKRPKSRKMKSERRHKHPKREKSSKTKNFGTESDVKGPGLNSDESPSAVETLDRSLNPKHYPPVEEEDPAQETGDMVQENPAEQ